MRQFFSANLFFAFLETFVFFEAIYKNKGKREFSTLPSRSF